MTVQAIACAKVNLSLRVGARHENGLHDLDGVFQSIGWVDELTLHSEQESDRIFSATSADPDGVIDGWNNLVWKALAATREAAASQQPIAIQLDKHVPAAAGLGGGSADAAAGLALGGRVFGIESSRLLEIAAGLGSDVPFCFTGGTARVVGTGAHMQSLDPVSGFAIALVVPPIELATGKVYSVWDDLGGPDGPDVGGRDLPPGLRQFDSLANDLYPAAAAVAPALDDWRAELAKRWGRPVLLTGSGPTLFAFFIDQAEAEEALHVTPVGARATKAASPVPFGWAMRDDIGAIEASSDVTPEVRQVIQTLAGWS